MDFIIQSKEKVPNKNDIKIILNNIKSNYILGRIFKILHRRISLKIMKYNKKIMNKLNINLNDYESFSEIEIKIIPAENKYGKIININNGKEKSYYHIYFNNSKSEINKYDFNKEDQVENIKIIIEYPVKSLNKLFCYCECIESIYFNKFYMNKINDMSNMCFGCSNLKEINFSNFNTDNVKDMSYMFYGCSSLKKLNLSNFNTKNVEKMNHMFYSCSSLEEIELSNFDTKNVNNMNHMFSWCTSLIKIDISNFYINKKNDVSWMFNGCSKYIKSKIKAQNKNIRRNAFN